MAKSLVASLGAWLIGSLIGRLLYPPPSQSKPEDLAGLKVSGPTPGSPIAVLWGTRRLRGHVIWAAAPISRGGGKKGGKKGGGGGGKKGGGGSETYFRSFAHAVCLGQAQLRQVLINDEVVWDVDDPSIATEAGVDLTWHEGTQDQDPDPRMAAQQASGGGGTNPTRTESTTLNGAAPTYTVAHLPVVNASEVIWYTEEDPEFRIRIIYMQRVASSPGQGQYTIDYVTGLVSFGGTYTNLPVTIRYQSGSLTGQQEALGYPNLAYAYWHEFETGTTATIPQPTYICGRLQLSAAEIGVTEIGVTGFTMQSTPDPNPDVGNRTTFDLFTVLPTGVVQVLGQYGTPAGSSGTAIDTFDAMLWHPDEGVWYCGVSRLTGVLILTIAHRIVKTATLPPPEWQDQLPGSIVFSRSFTGSGAGFDDRIWDLTLLGGAVYGLLSSPSGRGIVDVTADTVTLPPPPITSMVGLTEYNGLLYWLAADAVATLYLGTYAPATAQWVTLATVPGTSGGISGAKIERIGTRLYVVNGENVWRWNGTSFVAQTGLLGGARQIRELLPFGNRVMAVGQGYIASVPLTGDAWTVLDDVGASTATQFVGLGAHPNGDALVLSQGDGTIPYRLWRLNSDDQLAVIHTFDDRSAKDTSDMIAVGGLLVAGGYENDWNPVDVVAEIITDDLYGARVAGLLNQPSLLEMRQHVVTHDFLVSGVLEQRTTALSLIEQVMAHYMGWLAVRQGLFYFGGRRPETVTREIVLDDMLEDGLLTYSLAGPRDTKNKIIVDYTDRSRQYNTFPVSATDDPDRTQHHDRTESITLDWFCTAERAKRMADLLLVLRRLPAMALEALLGPKEIAMAPGDVAAVTVSRLGLFQEPVRILAVGEADREDLRGGFRVAMEREPAGLLEPRTYPIQPPVPSDPPPSPFVDVGPTLAAVWEMPAQIAGEDVVRTMFVVAGAHPDWRGAGVYLSLDGGITYDRVATYVGAGAAIGAVSRALPEGSSGWFDRDDVRVDVRASAGVLLGAVRNSALAGTTLSLLAGEPISYRDAALIASNQYRLRGTLRGWFEQPLAAHGVGSLFAFVGAFPGFPVIDHPASRVGMPLVVKVASINSAGREQDVAEAAEIPVTLQGLALMPSPVTGLQLLLGGVPQGSRRIIGTGQLDVQVGWRYARRDNPEDADLVRGDEVTLKHVDWLDYRVDVYTKATAGGTFGLRRTVYVTVEQHTYTSVQNISDNGAYHRFVRFDVRVRRLSGVLSHAQRVEIEVLV